VVHVVSDNTTAATIETPLGTVQIVQRSLLVFDPASNRIVNVGDTFDVNDRGTHA
jgi:hypothetical protein